MRSDDKQLYYLVERDAEFVIKAEIDRKIRPAAYIASASWYSTNPEGHTKAEAKVNMELILKKLNGG